MSILIQLLIVFILYKILKEVLSTSISIILLIGVFLVIYFIFGGNPENVTGTFGFIGRFFAKLPTTQFLDAIFTFLKSFANNIANLF